MKNFMLVMMGLLLVMPSIASAKMKAPGVLDEEKIMTDESLSKYETVGIRLFSYDDIKYENVDDDEKKEMARFMEDSQEKLAKTIRRKLESKKVEAVILEGDDAGKADLIVEGQFTKIDLGSAFNRNFWGMGSGQAGITVKGSLKDASDDETLADFEHENSSGLGSGEKWSMLDHEIEDLGDKIAEFIIELRK